MSSSPIDVRALTGQARDALRQGDAPGARSLCERALAGDSADVESWQGLALLLRQIGAPGQESIALDRVLARQPQHLPALVRKGDLYMQLGDRRAALSYHRAALKVGALIQGLPGEWQVELRRIEALCLESQRVFEAHVAGDLKRAGLGREGTARFGRAMDLLLGRRQIYHQQPRYFYFPELPEIQFFERDAFPWVRALEEAAPRIRAELEAVLASGEGIEPYMQRESRRPHFDNSGLLDDPSWSALHFFKKGEPVPEAAARCPATMAALSQVPLCAIKGRTPTALFSILRPGTHIPPHNGYVNTRLICHLPLILPPECALRVGNETRPWREGELMIFDDTIEHEAWNRSLQVRAVLLFDIWRPELSPIERALVAEMLESIDRFGGEPREWTQ